MKKNESFMQRLQQILKDTSIVWADEIKQLVKDEGVFLFVVVVPLLYPILYSWIYNNEVVREVPVVVIDKSHSAESREFIRHFNAAPDVEVAYYCNNLAEAQELIGRQKAYGILSFPSDFDTRINRGEQSPVSVYCDMSLMLTYKAIFQTAQGVATMMSSHIQIAASPGYTERDEELTVEPMEVDAVPIFNPTGGYGNAILPGVLMVILQQTLLLGIGMGAGTQRERNRWGNLIPVSRHYTGVFRVVTGKALCYVMIYAVIGAYLALMVPTLFSFTHLATGKTLIALLAPYILACTFFGLTVSCLVRYRENVMLLVVFTSIIFLFMTGISWPQSNIGGHWETISWLFPSTFGVRGFLRISSMGATLDDIQPELIALWIQALAYFLTACIVYRVQVRRMISTAKR